MTESRTEPGLTIRIVYVDLPDLIEFEGQVMSGGWGGVASAYVSPAVFAAAVDRAIEWTHRPEGTCVLDAGDEATGLLRLRFYTIDLAGHVVCQIQLATNEATKHRGKSVRRLSIEMPTEIGLIEQFARNLRSVVAQLEGEAVLQGLG